MSWQNIVLFKSTYSCFKCALNGYDSLGYVYTLTTICVSVVVVEGYDKGY